MFPLQTTSVNLIRSHCVSLDMRTDAATAAEPVRSARVPPRTFEHRSMQGGLLVAILLLGLAFRTWDLWEPFVGDLSYNEVFYATIAKNFDTYGLLEQYNYGYGGSEVGHLFFSRPLRTSSPLVPWVVYGANKLFGNSEAASRLPFLFFSFSSLLLVFGITRYIYDATAALIATFVAAIMPALVFYSRAIQLDSPMVAFGLAALLALMAFARKGSWPWLAASALCFALALLAKYQAVLFLPALACVGAECSRPSRWRRRGLLAAAYLGISALPALLWFAFTLTLPADPTADRIGEHLVRSGEWGLQSWVAALVATVGAVPDYTSVFGYLFAILLAVIIFSGQAIEVAKQSRLVLSLGLPWFAQAVYPLSWANNLYYLYPVMYSVAIGLGTAGAWLCRAVAGAESQSRLRPLIAVALVSTLACALDYRAAFHGTYHPWAAVSRQDPLLSARIVHERNLEEAPVLADQPQTLFYATGGQPNGVALPFWVEEAAMVAAIESGRFRYVVFTLAPTVDVVDALGRSGYRRIGPAAWAIGPV
jgi:4-amino-4-deoxy-L-arabinose transferase-like glycosyltransferase